MYSKTRNTLTALVAASLFVVSGWLFGHPVAMSEAPQPQATLNSSLAGTGLPDANLFISGVVDARLSAPRLAQVSSTMQTRRANRLSLAMPYYSFAMLMPQHRTY